MLVASQSKPPSQELDYPSPKSGDSCLCSSPHSGHLSDIERLTTQTGDASRPIWSGTEGVAEAYTIDHRPIWLRSAAPLGAERTTTCTEFPRKASGLFLPLDRPRRLSITAGPSTTGRLRAPDLAPRKGMAFSSHEVGGKRLEGMCPRPGLHPEPTRSSPFRWQRDTRGFPGDQVPFEMGGRRRPWTRRPAVLLSFQRTRGHGRFRLRREHPSLMRLPGCRGAGPGGPAPR